MTESQSSDSQRRGVGTDPMPRFENDSISDPTFFFSSLIDSLPVNVVCKDTSGRFIYVNQAFADLVERPSSEIIGKTDFDLSSNELAEKYVTDDRLVMETGTVFREVEDFVCADGEKHFFETRKTPLRSADGTIIGVKAVFWDVSAQKHAESAVENEKFLLDALMDNVPDCIYFKDIDSRFLRVSAGMATKFGIPDRKKIVGKTDDDIFSEEHAEQARRDELRIIRTKKPVLNLVEKETWEDAPDTWCQTTKMPLYNVRGAVVGTFGISRDITDLVLTEEALRNAKIAADAANRAKSDFLANMSHEIRTPMNAVLGITELLLDTDLTNVQRDYLNMVLSSGESLLSLINDILDFSKIEAGKFELVPSRFDVRDALGDTARVLGMRANTKNLELAFSVDQDVPIFLVGDVGRLRQIIINLVGNAIKFTATGEVVISVECTDRINDNLTLLIKVSDTGIGIPETKLDLVFQEFEQADSSTTRDYGGTGLGLAISSRLVELMGGQIWAESKLGVGSTFAFTAELQIPEHESETPTAKPIVIEGLPALIVDDNETNRLILNNMLLNWGMRPVVADSAEQALQMLRDANHRQEPISLVLTDVNMPTMDGFGLTAVVRSEPETADTTVIMLTSGMREGDLEKCKQLGIEFHLIKPLKQSEVFDAIITAVGVKPESAQGSADATTPADDSLEVYNVLLVEDNLVNQKLAIGVLGQQNHVVTIANNGQEGIDIWASDDFDLILMDVQMPVMDGFAATKEIRRREKKTGAHIPIIAMTARAMEKDREACLAAGMDDYLSKPIRIKELTAKINALSSAETAASLNPDLVSETSAPQASAPQASAPQASPEASAIVNNPTGPPISSTPITSGRMINWETAAGNVNGDSTLLSALVQVLRDNAPRLIEKIEAAIQDSDTAELKLISHTLKGSVLFLGEPPLSQVAKQMESLGERKQISGAVDLLVELKQQWRLLEAELRAWHESNQDHQT